jgi:hypothetical protein
VWFAERQAGAVADVHDPQAGANDQGVNCRFVSLVPSCIEPVSVVPLAPRIIPSRELLCVRA